MHWSPIGPDFEGRGRGREPASVSHKVRLKQVRDRHQTWVSRRFQHWPPDLDHRFGTRDTLPTYSVRGGVEGEATGKPRPCPPLTGSTVAAISCARTGPAPEPSLAQGSGHAYWPGR